MFLWFNNVEKGDFRIVGYRNLRLSFGLKCSPMILMISLYIMLVMNKTGIENIDNMKKDIYNSAYMDNCSYSTETEKELIEAFGIIPMNYFSIF